MKLSISRTHSNSKRASVEFEHNGEFRTLKKRRQVVAMNNQWISVKDRLPEKHNVWVLVFEGLYIWLAYYDHILDVWRVADGSVRNVTHWMPLPQPPEVQS